jgi:hypothetical protein
MFKEKFIVIKVAISMNQANPTTEIAIEDILSSKNNTVYCFSKQGKKLRSNFKVQKLTAGNASSNHEYRRAKGLDYRFTHVFSIRGEDDTENHDLSADIV